jgi:hypothetical protein
MAFHTRARKVGEEYGRVLREIEEADVDLQDALSAAEQREQRDTERREASARRVLEGRNAS